MISNLNNYVFGWKKNDQVFSTDSGYAKNAFLFQQSYLDDTEDIDVTSQDNSTSAIAEGKVSIPVYSPKILMYAKDPINGNKSQVVY